MTTASPTPRRVRTPNWFDLRLVAGVVLVLVSVVGGALVVSRADSTSRIWAVARDLAAGTVVTDSDIKAVKVRLPDRALYLTAEGGLKRDSPVGKTVNHQLYSGELLPRAALDTTAPATTITVPLTSDQAPRIVRGQLVELWLSSRLCPAKVILPSVAVQDVQTTGGGAFGTSGAENVVIRVPRDDADRVIAALGLSGTVIRAGLLDGGSDPAAEPILGDLTHCGTAS